MSPLLQAAKRHNTLAQWGHWTDACLFSPGALVAMFAIVVLAVVGASWVWSI